MCRIFYVLFFVVSLFHLNHASANCDGIGFLVLRSSVVQEKVYQPFIDSECVSEGNLVFGGIDYNPLTANQIRDLDNLRQIVDEMAERSPRGIVVLGYSESGKFAAKLASLSDKIKALFLMDPVDGTPPFSSPKRFPIFLDDKFPKLKIPTVILESEFGSKFRRIGHSCVPEDMGPKRFYMHVESQYLTKIFMDGLGHADFLRRTGPNLVEIMCGTGTVDKDEAFSRVLIRWTQFVEQITQNL